MKKLLFPVIVVLLCAVPALAQDPATHTDPPSDGVPDLTEYFVLPFQGDMTLRSASSRRGTLHEKILDAGMCMRGTVCTFVMHVLLVQSERHEPDVQILRYVLLNERGRIEGFGFAQDSTDTNRYWQLHDGSWVEYEAGTPQYEFEERFTTGTWKFVINEIRKQ